MKGSLRYVTAAAIAGVLLAAAPAAVAQAFINRNVNMRAGPDRVFPVVTWLPANTPVRVFGCTSGWRWCDVASGRNRGWVHASYLSNMPRPRTPIVTFVPGAYWDLHYRGRPWYPTAPGWAGWGQPSWRPPPPPPPRVRW